MLADPLLVTRQEAFDSCTRRLHRVEGCGTDNPGETELMSTVAERTLTFIYYCLSVSPLLLPYSVQLQHSEDCDTVSACWVILVFSIVYGTLTWTTG